MAEFKKAIEKTFRAEGGFQQNPSDNANYVNGKLIGTCRGISASGFFAFHKRVPTVEEMKALTQEQAMEIFKGNYWNKVAGDSIKNQSVAELMFQFIIGSGASQLSDLKALANLAGNSHQLVCVDVAFTADEATFVNALNQKIYFEQLWSWRKVFLNQCAQRSVEKWEREHGRKITQHEAITETKMQFLNGWLNRLNTHVFIP